MKIFQEFLLSWYNGWRVLNSMEIILGNSENIFVLSQQLYV
jgi:hypothetical protein